MYPKYFMYYLSHVRQRFYTTWRALEKLVPFSDENDSIGHDLTNYGRQKPFDQRSKKAGMLLLSHSQMCASLQVAIFLHA